HIRDWQQLDEADLVHHHQPIDARHFDAHRKRRTNGHQKRVQQERHENRQQRKRCPNLAPEQVPPDERQEPHTTVSISTPFSRWTVRVARSAACGSCVTITIVFPWSRLSACSSSRTSSPALRSRSPVGSSQSSSVGSVTTARAMPTRCSCPPESWRGKCRVRCERPTTSSAV